MGTPHPDYVARSSQHLCVPHTQNGTWLLGLQECMLPFVPWFESIQNTGYISFEESGKGAWQWAWLAIELLHVIHLSSNERLAIKILLWLLFKSGRYGSECPMQVHAMWMALNQLLGWEHSWTSKVFRSKSGSVLCGSPILPPHYVCVYTYRFSTTTQVKTWDVNNFDFKATIGISVFWLTLVPLRELPQPCLACDFQHFPGSTTPFCRQIQLRTVR